MAVFQSLINLFAGSPAVHTTVEPAAETTYSVRPLTQKQLDEVVALNLRCFKNGENYTKNTFAYLFNEPNSLCYRVVTADGDMAGFICVLVNESGSAHITTIGVAPEHRRRGLGRLLLQHLETRLVEKGISTIALEVRVSNRPAQELYLEHGYAIVQRVERYYTNGEDGFLMVRSLV